MTFRKETSRFEVFMEHFPRSVLYILWFYIPNLLLHTHLILFIYFLGDISIVFAILNSRWNKGLLLLLLLLLLISWIGRYNCLKITWRHALSHACDVHVIDLFGLYILFSQYRLCDNTQEAWSFVLFIKKSACRHIHVQICERALEILLFCFTLFLPTTHFFGNTNKKKVLFMPHKDVLFFQTICGFSGKRLSDNELPVYFV